MPPGDPETARITAIIAGLDRCDPETARIAKYLCSATVTAKVKAVIR